MQKTSGRLIDRTQSLDRDRLKIIMSPQSCIFRLFARSCHLRHTARTLHGKINVRVSRGADNCHIPHQGPAAFKWNQRDTIWSLAVLTYQANWLFGNWDPSSCESSSNEIVQHMMSGRFTRGLFADKAVLTASVIIIIIIIIIKDIYIAQIRKFSKCAISS